MIGPASYPLGPPRHSDSEGEERRRIQHIESSEDSDSSGIVEPPAILKKSTKQTITSGLSRIISSSSSKVPATFATLSVHHQNKIRIVKFPNSLIVGIRKRIIALWPKGIKQDDLYGDSWQIVLHNNTPKVGNPDLTPVVLRDILAYLYTEGWIIETSTNPTKKGKARDTFIFRSQPIPPPATFMTITFHHHSALHLAGADTESINALRASLTKNSVYRSSKAKTAFWQIKIKGSPWVPVGKESVHTRLVMIAILEGLDESGWKLYTRCSLGPNLGRIYSERCCSHRLRDKTSDTWYCIKLS